MFSRRHLQVEQLPTCICSLIIELSVYVRWCIFPPLPRLVNIPCNIPREVADAATSENLNEAAGCKNWRCVFHRTIIYNGEMCVVGTLFGHRCRTSPVLSFDPNAMATHCIRILRSKVKLVGHGNVAYTVNF